MKKAIFNFRNLLFILALGGLVACEGPEGPEGPAGQKGDQGIQGAAGPQGPAGEDGQDGKDGNANVTIISLLAENITWVEGDYIGRPAYTYSFENEAVNKDVIDHGLVIGYCKVDASWYQLPYIWIEDATYFEHILHTYSLNTITIYSYETGGALDPGATSEFRFLVITDNTITTKGASAEDSILGKLKEAGVDVNNYYEVLEYYGVKY